MGHGRQASLSDDFRSANSCKEKLYDPFIDFVDMIRLPSRPVKVYQIS
jgi:hypothetical protein